MIVDLKNRALLWMTFSAKKTGLRKHPQACCESRSQLRKNVATRRQTAGGICCDVVKRIGATAGAFRLHADVRRVAEQVDVTRSVRIDFLHLQRPGGFRALDLF